MYLCISIPRVFTATSALLMLKIGFKETAHSIDGQSTVSTSGRMYVTGFVIGCKPTGGPKRPRQAGFFLLFASALDGCSADIQTARHLPMYIISTLTNTGVATRARAFINLSMPLPPAAVSET